MQLYKFYYKNTNNLLPSYFSSFTPFYNNENHNHNLRNNILRLPMTRHEYFVQCTKYQLLKLIRENPQDDLNRCTQLNIIQFLAYFKYSIINSYNPLCNLKKCYMSVVDISLFRWFCPFLHCLRFVLETLHLIVLHCINTIIYTNMYHTALPLLALTIPPPSQPLPTPHLFHLTPPPPTHTFYI